MKLKTINTVLKLFGFVMMVSIDDKNESVSIWIERAGSRKRRVR